MGPLPIRAYALFIILGIIVACWWGEKRWQARGGHPGVVLDVAIWAVPFGIIGGRIYHVATDYWRYFGEGRNPLNAFKIWDGGLGIWGAVAFGALGAIIGLWRMGLKRAIGPFADAIAPTIVLAQGVGRLGNYFNQELYGRETTVPWGLEIYRRYDDATNTFGLTAGHSTGEVVAVVHPTFLYELLWNVAVAIILVIVDRRLRLGGGRVFALYVALYCFGRFFVELMRSDEATLVFGLRINTIVSLVIMLAAVAYLIATRRVRREPPDQLRPIMDDGPSASTVDATDHGASVPPSADAQKNPPTPGQ